MVCIDLKALIFARSKPKGDTSKTQLDPYRRFLLRSFRFWQLETSFVGATGADEGFFSAQEMERNTEGLRGGGAGGRGADTTTSTSRSYNNKNKRGGGKHTSSTRNVPSFLAPTSNNYVNTHTYSSRDSVVSGDDHDGLSSSHHSLVPAA